METHALNIFNQHTMPPVQVGPYLPPRPIIKRDEDMKVVPTGTYHPVAHAAGEIHKSILDLLLRLHGNGSILALLGTGHREIGGTHNRVHIY